MQRRFFSIWRDCGGCVLLPTNVTINARVCCQHLVRLYAAFKKKKVLLNRKSFVLSERCTTQCNRIQEV